MIQDVTEILGFPEILKSVIAVSDIHEICSHQEQRLCFTITFQNDSILNVFRQFTETDRSNRFGEVKDLHEQVMEYLAEVRQNRLRHLYEKSDTTVSGKE